MSSYAGVRLEFAESGDICKRFRPGVIDQPALIWTGAFSLAALDYADALIHDPAYADGMRLLDKARMVIEPAGFLAIPGYDVSFRGECVEWRHVRVWGLAGRAVRLSQLIPGEESAGKVALMTGIVQNLRVLASITSEEKPTYLWFWTCTGAKDDGKDGHDHKFPFAAMNIAGRATIDADGTEFPSRCTSFIPANRFHKSPKLIGEDLRLNITAFQPR